MSSPEPKARQTLEPVGRVFADSRFGEVARDERYYGDSGPAGGFRAELRLPDVLQVDVTARTLEPIESTRST